ncbi:hypothetical protein [Streptomyces sp. V3I7]|uniref:hypothetical protein n=1 Tax=Streptomyces sp. V3I7 TaxID=3042278 RepID=UPI002788D6A9|nr:hypothetical protein [Streptomyces sp. V3I7]MDQ0992587.1 hypothetical protein [Streptomyces sp. V3I7]
MPDRSLRLLTFPPHSVQGGERGAVLLRESPASPQNTERPGGDEPRQDDSPHDHSPQDDNPFAAPPEGTPDRPWQPRRPEGGKDGKDGSPESSGPSEHSPWGSQWSDRQPGRSSGGFGERPGGGPEGQSGGPGTNMRWDPTDPAQRRARYALLSGMWAFFFALFSWPYVALLLGGLSLYWGVSALRAKPRKPDPDSPRPAQTGRPQTTAAVGGLVTALLALALVATTFTAQLVYRDYYTCVDDALTGKAKQSCQQLLPKELRGVLGANNN